MQDAGAACGPPVLNGGFIVIDQNVPGCGIRWFIMASTNDGASLMIRPDLAPNPAAFSRFTVRKQCLAVVWGCRQDHRGEPFNHTPQVSSIRCPVKRFPELNPCCFNPIPQFMFGDFSVIRGESPECLFDVGQNTVQIAINVDFVSREITERSTSAFKLQVNVITASVIVNHAAGVAANPLFSLEEFIDICFGGGVPALFIRITSRLIDSHLHVDTQASLNRLPIRGCLSV